MKTHQLSDYTTEKLSKDIIEYAALDALVSRSICEVILKKLECTVPNENEETKYVSIGDWVKIFIHRKIAVNGIVEIVGDNIAKKK